jgi:hypothetical protein
MKIFVFILIITFKLLPQEENNKKFFLGIVGGNPININPTAGMYFDDYGIRLSGGAWIYSRYGLQLDLTYVLSSKNSTQHQISIISAYAHNRKYTDNNFFYIFYHKLAEYEYINSFYFGLAYNFVWKGLFIQAGPALGTGNFKNPRLIMQLGYIHLLD